MGAALDDTTIPETSWARAAVAQQRAYFESGATRGYAFRIEQLKRLKDAIVRSRPRSRRPSSPTSGARRSRRTSRSARPSRTSTTRSST